MDSIDFINKYHIYVAEIKSVIKPELYSVIEEMNSVDPHDIVSPERWFPDENSARGLVWSLFLKKVKMRGLPIKKKGSS